MVASLSTTASMMLASSSTTSVNSLAKMGNGEYTAASVAADPTDANKLGLVKEKDGNYGTSAPAQVEPSSSSSAVSNNTQSALSGLVLGGA